MGNNQNHLEVINAKEHDKRRANQTNRSQKKEGEETKEGKKKNRNTKFDDRPLISTNGTTSSSAPPLLAHIRSI